MNDAVRERVFEVVSQVMGVPVAEIDEHSSPDTMDAWDSLTGMNLVLALEEAFGVLFTDQQILEMLNVELIVLVVSEALAAEAA